MANAVGQRLPSRDSLNHIEGRTVYVDDLYFPGMLYCKACHSPHPNARILNIDISKARELPGVAAVLTHKDVPFNRYGTLLDQPVLAEEFVRYQGEPVAAVAAVDEDAAQEAADLIRVDFEALKPVFDPLEAMLPDAPVIHEGGNIAHFGKYPCRQIRKGDVEAGFRDSDLIVEGTYTTPMQEHAPLEPHVGVAICDASGKLTIYTVSQALNYHASQISSIFKIPLSKVRMVGGTVGGAFGGKNELATDHIIALLAMKTRKPVKWRWTRQLEFLISSVRNPWRMEYRDGVKRDGRLIVRKIRNIQDSGAYDIFGKTCMDKHCFMNCGPYRVPNVWVDGYVVFTNKQPTGALRGFGITQAAFAWEVQMDKCAEAIGMDPIEFRLINVMRDGDYGQTGQQMWGVGATATLLAAAKEAGIKVPDKYISLGSSERGRG